MKKQGGIGTASPLKVDGNPPADCRKNGKFREVLHKAQSAGSLWRIAEVSWGPESHNIFFPISIYFSLFRGKVIFVSLDETVP